MNIKNFIVEGIISNLIFLIEDEKNIEFKRSYERILDKIVEKQQ